ncbi:hypothetical protein [Acidovorax temperans]|uniref:hypothetical protein n=1 Tax=Acidovorax temperans TaxID=80878 RepID=UPI00289C2094|nr:hypothetical protein [Acidovorax temperans]
MDEMVHEGRESYAVPQHRAALRDARLSWGARGLFNFLWDLPSNWKPNAAHLAEMGPEGRAAVLSRLAELQKIGALRLEKLRDPGNKKLSGTRWVIVTPVRWAREAPLKKAEIRKNRESENLTLGFPDCRKSVD